MKGRRRGEGEKGRRGEGEKGRTDFPFFIFYFSLFFIIFHLLLKRIIQWQIANGKWQMANGKSQISK
jgi:hypothetical protein